MGEGRVREFGMDVYTVLCLKWITNKDLPYGKGTAQRNVAAWMGGVWGRMDTCMAESPHCSPETITLLTGYTPVQNKV